MWFANFFVAASATMVMPFLSLYIETFGDFSTTYVQRWSGFVFAITFLVAFLVSPFWGRFGDHYGRKKILIITSFGIATSIFLMGFVHSVHGLFILRLFMGIVTGFIPTSIAFISAQTPKNIAGKTLGTLQMGNVSGALLGPMMGGTLADAFGFKYTFVITGVVIALAGLLVAFGVKDMVVEANNKNKEYTRKEVLSLIFHKPTLLIVMILALLVQVANFSIQPQLALFVSELITSPNIAFLAGVTFSVTGLGNLLFTRHWGKLGDRIGYEKVIFVLLLLSALFFIPQGFVQNIWQLIFLRFLFGMSIGGLIPCITAFIRNAAPVSVQGEVLGYNQSFRFLGNVIGPIIGGFISGIYGFTSIFVISGILFLLAALLLWGTTHRKNTRTSHSLSN